MGNALKILVAAACIAVLGAVWVAFSDRNATIAAQEREAAIIERADDMHARSECVMQVRDWEGGSKAALIREFGDYAADVVKSCKWRWGIDATSNP